MNKRSKKDREKVKSQGKDLNKLRVVVQVLVSGGTLDKKYKDHSLHGKPYQGCRECHIEPDWLFIYYIENDILYLVRNGSHSELF